MASPGNLGWWWFTAEAKYLHEIVRRKLALPYSLPLQPSFTLFVCNVVAQVRLIRGVKLWIFISRRQIRYRIQTPLQVRLCQRRARKMEGKSGHGEF